MKEEREINQMIRILFWLEVALAANRVNHLDGTNEQTGPTHSVGQLGYQRVLKLFESQLNP